MTSIVLFIVSLIVILILVVIISVHEENAAKKEKRERRISNIKYRISAELESIKAQCAWPSEETFDSLVEYHKRMVLMESDPEIVRNLKPYDEYYRGKLRKKSALNDDYAIVVDKNLKPRFLPAYYLSDNKEKRDIEISVCPNLKEFGEFIDECKKIIMDKKIDKFRKKQIEEKLK